MILPTIHNNGTSRDRLVESVCTVRQAIEDVLQAMREMTPNGRDYYPQGPEALAQAEQQFDGWRKRLVAVSDELMVYAEAILDA